MHSEGAAARGAHVLRDTFRFVGILEVVDGDVRALVGEASAMPRPMPRPAPVTSATLSVSLKNPP